jgi:hypothetical protein
VRTDLARQFSISALGPTARCLSIAWTASAPAEQGSKLIAYFAGRDDRAHAAASCCFSLLFSEFATLSNLVAHRLGWHLRKLNATMNSFQYAFLHSALQNSAFSSGCQPE